MTNGTINPTCQCCFPAQTLVLTGQRAYCPLTERIYDNVNRQADINNIVNEPITDFYPGRTRRKGEAAAFSINPAEERFGA